MTDHANQLNLFDQLAPAVRNNDHSTCVEPKSRISNAAKLLKVYYFRDHTDEEAVQTLLGRPATLSDEGIRRRASDLRQLGLIVPTGGTRPNDRGRERIVCEITDAGRQLCRKLFVNEKGVYE